MSGEANTVEQARALATSAHEGQRDKIGEAYIHHPAAVASLLVSSPGFGSLSPSEQEIALAAAWLHDVLEDTPLQPEDLESEGFGEKLISVVVALTHLPGEPRQDYYTRVSADPLARIVKIADVAHNSSEERMRWLDADTRDRLKHKYSVASTRLLATEEERIWFANSVSATPPSSRYVSL